MDNYAGKLRHQITIRRMTRVDDGRGGFASSWATIATPRARVEGLAGREVMIGQALQGVRAYRITIRFRSDLLQSDQLTLKGGLELNIRSIDDPDGLRRWLTIMADTGSAVQTS